MYLVLRQTLKIILIKLIVSYLDFFGSPFIFALEP